MAQTFPLRPTPYLLKSTEAYRIARSDINASADNRDLIQAALTAAAADGVRKVILPRGEIPLGSQITFPAGANNMWVAGQGDDTVVKQIAGAVSKALFYGSGTDGTKTALTADVAAGATNVDIPTAVASTLVPGSLLGLECQTVVWGLGGGNQEGFASEVRKVVAVSGTTVTVDGPLMHAYTVAASAVAWKMTPLVGARLSDLVFTSADAATIKARSVLIERARNVRVGGIWLRDVGGGLYANDVIDSTWTDIQVDGLPNVSNFLGYGVAVAGRSAHAYIENLRGRNFRHIFTTLADERTVNSVTTQWGGPRHITVRGGVGEAVRSGTQYSIWDTHPYGYDIVFDQCRAFGGSGSSSNGFQIRSKFTRLINPVALYSGASGIRCDPTTSSDTEIVGGEIAYAAGNGLGTAPRTRIRGTHIHDNVGVGAVIGSTSGGSRIADCRIERNSVGIHDQSAGEHTGIEIENNTIPKAGTQTFAFLSPKSDMMLKGNKTPGFASLTAAIGGSPASTIRTMQNVSDAADSIDGGTAAARGVLVAYRGSTAATWASSNPVLGLREPGFETDTGKLKIGDGATAWNALAYFGISPTQRRYFSTFGSVPALAAMSGTNAVAVTSANQAYVVNLDPAPFDMTIASLRWYCSATGGNYDIGLFAADNTTLWRKGSTVTPAVGLVTETLSSPIAVLAGTRLKLAWAADGTAQSIRGTNTQIGDLMSDMDGSPLTVLANSSFPLPATLTPGTTAQTRVPLVAFRSS